MSESDPWAPHSGRALRVFVYLVLTRIFLALPTEAEGVSYLKHGLFIVFTVSLMDCNNSRKGGTQLDTNSGTVRLSTSICCGGREGACL